MLAQGCEFYFYAWIQPASEALMYGNPNAINFSVT